MEIAVLDKNGKDTGRKITLDDTVFKIEPNEHVVYLEVKQYLAAQRQGTHKAKQRSEIKGSTRKLHRQKGTGGSRKGDIKNPLFRGGGRIFGPQPRDYNFKLNKTVKRLAKRSVLSQKIKENTLKIIEDFQYEAPKTKEFNSLLEVLNIRDKKSLFILGEMNKNVYLSSRNIQATQVLPYSEVSSYDILRANEVILFESSVEQIQKILS